MIFFATVTTPRQTRTRAGIPSLWLHRYAVCVAVCTALLVFAGGLVTSTGAGLSVPDWPLSYGMIFPPMVGNVLYEHGHRMIATAVGLMTIVLAVWLPAILFGWVPVAGDALLVVATLVTWALATTGFGAAVLTRGGVRTTFGRRFHPPQIPSATLYERPGGEISTSEWLAGRAR